MRASEVRSDGGMSAHSAMLVVLGSSEVWSVFCSIGKSLSVKYVPQLMGSRIDLRSAVSI